MTFLLLGGSPEAARLATQLSEAGFPYESAQVNPHQWIPALPPAHAAAEPASPGWIRDRLDRGDIRGLIDGGHPFATDTTGDAVELAHSREVPIVKLQAPSWEEQILSEGRIIGEPYSNVREYAAARLARRDPLPITRAAPRWRWADDAADARRIADIMGHHRTLLDVGRDRLVEFAAWRDRFVLARSVARPDWPVPDSWQVLQADWRITAEQEYDLYERQRLELVVTRDIGGSPTSPVWEAAERLGIFVVMIRRPALPEGLEVVHSCEEAYRWVQRTWRPQDHRSARR